MRSGVIAQKMGMTRLFTEAGEHVPVTVLRLAQCQVVAHRSKEKDGYVALQLGSGTRKVKNVSKAERGRFAVAKVEPKRTLAEFRVSDDALIPVGAEITADHFVVGQFVDVTGTSHRQGLRRRHEALELRRPARLARRVGLAPLDRFDRRPPGPRQDLQEQEDAGPYGHRPRHHAQPARRADRRRARPDHDRGRGARSQGRLDHRARRGEEGAAEGCCRSPASSRRRAAEAAEPKAEAAPAAEAPKEGA